LRRTESRRGGQETANLAESEGAADKICQIVPMNLERFHTETELKFDFEVLLRLLVDFPSLAREMRDEELYQSRDRDAEKAHEQEEQNHGTIVVGEWEQAIPEKTKSRGERDDGRQRYTVGAEQVHGSGTPKTAAGRKMVNMAKAHFTPRGILMLQSR
jgi:hypothetical protein